MNHEKTFYDLPAEIIAEIFLHLPDTDLINCALYITQFWKEVAQNHKVWVNRKYEVTGEEKETEVVEVAQIIPQLRILQFTDTADTFDAVFTGETLHVSCNLIKKVRTLRSLLTKCLNVTELHIPSFLLQKEDFAVMVSEMQNLRALFPENTKGHLDLPIVLKAFADGTPQLAEVDFSNLCYDIEDMHYFLNKKASQLQKLTINWRTNDDTSALPLLINCRHSLKNLKICVNGQGRFETAAILDTLKDLSALTELHFMDIVNIDSVEMTCALLTASFSQLRCFSIASGFYMQDDVLLALCTSCPLLQQIKLQDSRYITGRGLELLSNCSNLLMLDLSGCQRIYELGTIQQCSKLTALFLTDCWSLQPSSLIEILQLSELRILRIDFCVIEGFPLSNLRVYLPHLEFLGINGCHGYSRNSVEELRISASGLVISYDED